MMRLRSEARVSAVKVSKNTFFIREELKNFYNTTETPYEKVDNIGLENNKWGDAPSCDCALYVIDKKNELPSRAKNVLTIFLPRAMRSEIMNCYKNKQTASSLFLDSS